MWFLGSSNYAARKSHKMIYTVEASPSFWGELNTWPKTFVLLIMFIFSFHRLNSSGINTSIKWRQSQKWRQPQKWRWPEKWVIFNPTLNDRVKVCLEWVSNFWIWPPKSRQYWDLVLSLSVCLCFCRNTLLSSCASTQITSKWISFCNSNLYWFLFRNGDILTSQHTKPFWIKLW